MADMASSIRTQQSVRNRALVVPREHGAWGLLLIPLVTGACIGIPFGHGLKNLVLFLIATLSLFWLRTPVESYFGMGAMRANTREERRLVLRAIAGILPVALASLAALMWNGNASAFLLIGCVAGTAFAAQAGLKLLGRHMRMMSQIVGSLGLSATAAGAYCAVTGEVDAKAFAVWLACWLFAGNQIHYVQARLRNSRIAGPRNRFAATRGFMIGQFVMLLVVAAASRFGLLPPAAALAFIPVVFRGLFWLVDEDSSLDLQWLGVTELLHGITFGVLLTSTFFLHR